MLIFTSWHNFLFCLIFSIAVNIQKRERVGGGRGGGVGDGELHQQVNSVIVDEIGYILVALLGFSISKS